MLNFASRGTALALGLFTSTAFAQVSTTPGGSQSSSTSDTGATQNVGDLCPDVGRLGPEARAECERLRALVNNPAHDASLFDFNYGEPGSPVLPLVGVQSDQITRVESLRRFGLSVLTGLGSEDGPAIGIDISPFWLLARGAVTAEDYQRYSYPQRVFARTKLAGAAGRGDEGEGIPSSLVLSFSSSLLDARDPILDETFDNCIRTGVFAVTRPQFDSLVKDLPSDPGLANAYFDRVVRPGINAFKPQIEEAYQRCVDQSALRMSQRPVIDVGAGVRLIGDPGHFRNFQNSGVIVWGTLATGFGGGNEQGGDRSWNGFSLAVRGVLHARYTFSEDFFDENGARTGQADSALLVAGLESVPVEGRPETLRWSLQAGWTLQNSPTAANEDRNYWRYLGMVRYRLREGLWLNGTVGRVSGRGIESDTYVSVGISIAPAPGSAGIDNFYRRTR